LRNSIPKESQEKRCPLFAVNREIIEEVSVNLFIARHQKLVATGPDDQHVVTGTSRTYNTDDQRVAK